MSGVRQFTDPISEEQTGGLYILGVGLLKQSGPELTLVFGTGKDGFPFDCWQLVVNHHVHPLPKPPELEGTFRGRRLSQRTERRGRYLVCRK